jgi:hypothetical protein
MEISKSVLRLIDVKEDNSRDNYELADALASDKQFVAIINKIIGPCVQKINILVPELDYRITGSRSYFNILDKGLLSGMRKLYHNGKRFQESLNTLDWDVIIIGNGDFKKLTELLVEKLNMLFGVYKEKLNLIIKEYSLSCDSIVYFYEQGIKYPLCHFSLEIKCSNGDSHNVSLLDLADLTSVENYNKFFIYSDIPAYDCHGYKYLGFLNILNKITNALNDGKFIEKKRKTCIKLLLVLNAACNNLINKSYYSQLKKHGDLKVYYDDLNKALNALSKIQFVKDTKPFKLVYRQTDESVYPHKSIQQLIYTEGETPLDDNILSNIKRAHKIGLMWVELKHHLVQKCVRDAIKCNAQDDGIKVKF